MAFRPLVRGFQLRQPVIVGCKSWSLLLLRWPAACRLEYVGTSATPRRRVTAKLLTFAVFVWPERLQDVRGVAAIVPLRRCPRAIFVFRESIRKWSGLIPAVGRRSRAVLSE